MRKNPMLNKIMSLGLAFALFVSSPVSVFAADDSDAASVETSVENTSEETVDATVGEPVSIEEAADTQDEISESGDADDASQTDSDESASEEKDSKAEKKVNNENTEDNEEASETEEELEKELEEADKDSEEEISYSYKSNDDGTHIKSWTDEDGEAHEETEDCTFDEDGKCEFCGYEKEEDSDEYKLSGTFTFEVSGYTITAEVPEGAYDEAVKFVVEEVELSEEEKSLVDEELSAGIATSYKTFDIGFKNKDDEKIEPNDSVKISITSSEIIEDSEIIHIDDEGNAENISVDATEGEVVFEAESFSTYTIAGVNYEYNPNQVLYNNSAYGSAFSSKEFDANPIAEYSIGNNNYGLLIRYGSPIKQLRGEVIAPKDGYYRAERDNQIYEYAKAYVYGSGCKGETEIHFVAPENYYIESVRTYSTGATLGYYEGYGYFNPENDTWKTTYTPSTKYATDYKVNIGMTKGKTTTVRVFLKQIPTEYTSEKTIVKGATIVNYNNDTTAFGDTFKFSGGGDSISSNQCHYGQVYQGLGAGTIGTTFKLASQNSNLLFPESLSGSYITSAASNVGVEFKKDTNGYWTLDSGNYKYVYNRNNKTDDANGVIEARSGDGFWPFQVNNGNDIHYGMELPINFSVNSTGSTTDANGNTADTIFRFSGDDDVFVYVDGKLVLDLGGIHNAVFGQINFKTGDILIQGDDAKKKGDDADITFLTSSLDGSAYANKSLGTKNLYEIIDENNVGELSLKDHTLTVVYFERGAHESNCKISYNFEKNETTNVSYKGLKLKEIEDGKYNPLKGATFTLYNDKECTSIAKVALGTDAVAVSDEEGSILFENLSIGVADENNYASKTYYMKETAAADKYQTPDAAIWKLVVTYDKGKYTKELTALNDEAMALSLDKNSKEVTSNNTTVTGIVNYETPVAKKLSIKKVVSDGTNVNPDPNAKYVFYLGKYTGDDNSGNPVSTPVANQEYKVGNNTYTTDKEGKFSLKAEQTAVFENLYGKKYYVAEITVTDSEHEYTLRNYDTRIIVDDNYDSEDIETYANTVDSWRYKVVGYSEDVTEKSIKYENLFTNTTTNTEEKQLSKYITKNAADDYDLSLTFKAPVYSEQVKSTTVQDNYDKAELDIVVVLDLSNSMSGSKLTNAKKALNAMVDSVNTDEIDANWKLVKFGSYAEITSNWVSSSSIKSTVNGLSVYTGNNGGTNYQDALVKANTAIGAGGRDDAKKVVIFITDGEPTAHLGTRNSSEPNNNGGYWWLGGGDHTEYYDYLGALMGAKALNCDYFYAVGIELSSDTVYTTSSNEALNGLGLITKVANGVTNASVKSAYNSSQDELSTVLSNIAGSFGTIYGSTTGEKTCQYASNATIVDELSEYVEIIEGSEFNISVFDAEGNDVSGRATPGKLGKSNATFALQKDNKTYTFTASYSNEGYGKITLDLDSTSDYTLGDYTYKVTFKVKPSAAAYEYMAANESYPVIDGNVTVGEADTGITSAGEAGFYSNNSAYATYYYRGGQAQDLYNKPVVQVENFWDLQIIKVGENTDTPLAGAEFVLTTLDKSKAYYGKTYEDGAIHWYANTSDRDDDKLANQVVIPAGNYTLVESKAPEGYAKSEDIWYITLDKKTGITGYINDESSQLTTVNDETTLSNGITKKIAMIYFRDEVAYTLPETGGRGVYIYTIGGILLMIAGALLLYKSKNNKTNRKGERNEMKKFKKIICLALAMVMMMAMSTVAFAKEATITVNNAENAILTYAQVIVADQTKSSGWEIVSGYEDAFKNLPDMENETDTQKLIDAYINAKESDRANALSNISTSETFTNGMTVTAAGLYVINATEDGYTYKTMAAYIGFDANTGANKGLVSATLNAKKEPTQVDKTADEKYVEINDEITYTVTSTIPYVPEDVVEGNTTTTSQITLFAINDKLTGAEYKLDAGKLAVEITYGGTTETRYVDVVDNGFKLDLTDLVNKDNTNANLQITAKYVAIAKSLEINNDAYPTVAGHDYDVDENGNKITKTVTSFSGKISLVKVDADNADIKLEGAEFVIVKKVNNEDNYAVLDRNNKLTGWTTDKNEASTIVTDADGVAKAEGFDKDNTYFVEEVKAPQGYALNSTQYEIKWDETVEAEAVQEGTTESAIPNTTLASLPFTGGMGTTIFTVLGVAIMAIAAALYFVSKKSAKN